MNELTPREIMRELDRYIIGQDEAKRAVAIALRNRYRRAQLDEDIRNEISPKNILMIGPTGVGKTEIARRLAKLVKAPFVKVEATKFTEVGYVGRDVESIIRDLTENAIRIVRKEFSKRVETRAACLRFLRSSWRISASTPAATRCQTSISTSMAITSSSTLARTRSAWTSSAISFKSRGNGPGRSLFKSSML